MQMKWANPEGTRLGGSRQERACVMQNHKELGSKPSSSANDLVGLGSSVNLFWASVGPSVKWGQYCHIAWKIKYNTSCETLSTGPSTQTRLRDY